ncbi:hypothetical protein C8A00DRAFT_46649 [Chaetomidium leptoderma]|uniref:F-box domain-containing protein n=1 Tax=Chaetomidium leptoderma TaxID=669021 RepID=A0AAN6VEV7_9PEZI|nr:hypothetical protein C8A00DRAFT_46649 [Chaetomidium leptoderma]
MEATKVPLLGLPPELIEQILRKLPVECIKSLRLVNKHMSVAVLGPCFHAFFARQTTNLAPASLSSLEVLLRNDVFGPRVRHVRVMAETSAIPSAEDTLATKRFRPLESALTNRHGDNFVVQLNRPTTRGTEEKSNTHLARFVSGPGLFSRPVARDVVGLDRQRLWARASHVYRLTMTALAKSGVTVSDLRIYSNTTGCSVPSYDVTIGLPGLLDVGLARSLASVKTLAFSFSTRVDHGWKRMGQVYGSKLAKREKRRQRLQWTTDDDDDEANCNTDDSYWDSDPEYDTRIAAEKGCDIRGRYGDTMPQPLCRVNFPGIALLLQRMPHLETLDLHMYQTLEYEAYGGGSRLHYYAAVFKHVVDGGLHFRQLKNLILRGLCVSADDLLTFMERHPHIKSLELHNVMLTAPVVGRTPWSAVLTKLCRNAVRQGASLSSVFCTDPYGTTNFLRLHETLESEWVERWWLRDCRGALISTTRRVLRDEFEREDVFGEDSMTWGGKKKEWWTPPTSIPRVELYALHEDRYGRTYGGVFS